jgi:hypothetical protein
MKYELKKGLSTVEGAPFNPLAETNYSFPGNRKDLEHDLMKALNELLKLKALYVDITNSPVQVDGGGTLYVADENALKRFYEIFGV